ncbi:hypothetical protein SAMN04488040_1097 [Sulfitobacter marinus]|uniref:DUF3299 domain-containing protein n=1 Tax=Sulfitobacter marinus TaxID=394264 RepID=A0A1I6QZI9_9RHOB|nr:DUF3299 domain-containing protein [Sulfitobacter marinus]SFS57668.1 hypothetical protein SAMN04488040_1097 [Sulfitobacter marinus]
MVNRRTALMLLSGFSLAPQASLAASPRKIMWDDLIPPGLPYAEIIGEGEIDMLNDTWNPVYDANAVKLNEALNGAYIIMPGFIIPFDISAKGVTSFMLVPYVGACIHTPPPPANQLVMVNSAKPWPSDQLWDAVWVTGTLRTQLQSTKLGQTGYSLTADKMKVFEW